MAGLVAVGLVASAATAAVVLLGDEDDTLPSWTTRPTTLTGPDAADARTWCLLALAAPDVGQRVVVAERKAGRTFVLTAGEGAEEVCLMPDDVVFRGSPGEPGLLGSSGGGTTAPTLAPDGLESGGSATGGADDGWFSWEVGWVGRDVTAVTVHVSTGLTLEAAVTAGRYAVWWPSYEPSSRHPDETWSYTVHLADGTTREVR